MGDDVEPCARRLAWGCLTTQQTRPCGVRVAVLPKGASEPHWARSFPRSTKRWGLGLVMVRGASSARHHDAGLGHQREERGGFPDGNRCGVVERESAILESACILKVVRCEVTD